MTTTEEALEILVNQGYDQLVAVWEEMKTLNQRLSELTSALNVQSEATRYLAEELQTRREAE